MTSFYDLQRKHLPPCTYCGEPATTKDHVPPTCVQRYSKTVPACRHCNCTILNGIRLLTVPERRAYVQDWHARRA